MRMFRWADAKTSLRDAFNLQLVAAPLVAIFVHHALQRHTDFLHVFRRNELLAFAAISFVYCLAIAAGFAILRRQRFARSVGTGFAIGSIVGAEGFVLLLFLKWSEV